MAGFEIYVDFTIIQSSATRKRRAVSDGLKWALLGEVTDVPSYSLEGNIEGAHELCDS